MTPKRTEYDPFEHAARLGIRVVYGRLRTRNAMWIPEQRAIIVKQGLRRMTERSALAHELGHVCHGHTEDHPLYERQADEWAARHLIDHDELLAAAAVSEDPGAWCVELDVTPQILEAYLRIYARQAA